MRDYLIPDGWVRVTKCKVEAGDRIRTATGWMFADRTGWSPVTLDYRSAVGHPTSLYECVIRRKSAATATAQAVQVVQTQQKKQAGEELKQASLFGEEHGDG